jgi:hypothetical protein
MKAPTKPSRNAVPLPEQFGRFLFLLRQAICLEAAFQETRLRGPSRIGLRIGNSEPFRQMFLAGVWHGCHSKRFESCSTMPTVTLTEAQDETRRAWISLPGVARSARYEDYWVERFAIVSAANFIRRLGQPQQPLLAPCIGDPNFRAGFMRRHGLDFTATEQTA